MAGWAMQHQHEGTMEVLPQAWQSRAVAAAFIVAATQVLQTLAHFCRHNGPDSTCDISSTLNLLLLWLQALCRCERPLTVCYLPRIYMPPQACPDLRQATSPHIPWHAAQQPGARIITANETKLLAL